MTSLTLPAMQQKILDELVERENRPLKAEESVHFSAAMLMALNALAVKGIVELVNNGQKYRMKKEAYNART